jgi:4-hydroxythreonine-4-phosphate dehydrogenase
MLGDAAGVGPEQCARILSDGRLADAARLVVIGDARVLEEGARAAGVTLAPGIEVIDLQNLDPRAVPRGRVSAESGRVAGETLAHMIRLALEGRLDGIAFAPLNKAALHAGGWRFPDEHQLFAHLLGHQGFFGEMNVLDDLWVSRATSHVSLRTALDQLTVDRIDRAITLADRTMRGAGVARPRLAVAALNPHAGEGGLFGREELEIIAPAVALAAGRGITCRGPFPADTVFLRAFAGEYDGVVSMFHDQGQIATKLRGFDRGVTITAGLEVVFATPAHGTAFDIAGRGVASTRALERAVRLCARLAASRMQARFGRETSP